MEQAVRTTVTKADMARDLLADLDICETATPGPWAVAGELPDGKGWECLVPLPGDEPAKVRPDDCVGADVQRRVISAEEADRIREEAFKRWGDLPPMPEDLSRLPADYAVPVRQETESVASLRLVGSTYSALTGDPMDEDTAPLRPHDAVFIAQAREGWPAAIRRAMAAEAERDAALVDAAFGPPRPGNGEALLEAEMLLRRAAEWAYDGPDCKGSILDDIRGWLAERRTRRG